MKPDAAIKALRERLGAVADVQAAIALLNWDQETYMPPKGAAARAHQLATLSALAHRLATDPQVGTLLDDLAQVADRLSYADARLVDIALYDYTRATRLPETFVHKWAHERSTAHEVWVKARRQSDFALFRPNLETMIELARRKAEFLGYEGSPYNALLEDYERGATVAQLEALFSDLVPRQRRLVERIVAAPCRPDTAWTDGEWDETAQRDFGTVVLRDMGYDLEAGRQDTSVHPFSTHFDLADVRITTRFNPRDLFSGLMGTIHEGGHALYSQGHDPEDARTPLADGASLGMHESQSRMWENMVGRSLPFWKRYTPILRRHVPGRLDRVTPEQVYAVVNRVRPSFIRVDADECTYDLHIILRFEIELALIEGRLEVADVPEVWNAKTKTYLGLDVPDDARGCLQDIHWSHGAFGYFPTYTLGNLYAARMLEAIERDIPDLWPQIEAGAFGALLDWLREKVHRHGRRKLAVEIMGDIAGQELSPESHLNFLERKFSALYGL